MRDRGVLLPPYHAAPTTIKLNTQSEDYQIYNLVEVILQKKMNLFAVLAFTLSTIALLLIWCFDHTGWADVIAFFAAIGGFALGFYVDQD